VTKKEHKRDKYLRSKHGISLKEYKQMDKEQDHVCAICRRPPKNLPLAVDHWHKLTNKTKKHRVINIEVKKKGKYWVACAPLFHQLFGIKIKERHTTRRKAIKAAQLHLTRASVRGLLCWSCNTGIRKYFDCEDKLYNAAKYIAKYKKKFDWSKL